MIFIFRQFGRLRFAFLYDNFQKIRIIMQARAQHDLNNLYMIMFSRSQFMSLLLIDNDAEVCDAVQGNDTLNDCLYDFSFFKKNSFCASRRDIHVIFGEYAGRRFRSVNHCIGRWLKA